MHVCPCQIGLSDEINRPEQKMPKTHRGRSAPGSSATASSDLTFNNPSGEMVGSVAFGGDAGPSGESRLNDVTPTFRGDAEVDAEVEAEVRARAQQPRPGAAPRSAQVMAGLAAFLAQQGHMPQ